MIDSSFARIGDLHIEREEKMRIVTKKTQHPGNGVVKKCKCNEEVLFQGMGGGGEREREIC